MNEPEQPPPSSDNDTVDPIAADPVRDGTTIVFAGDPGASESRLFACTATAGTRCAHAGTAAPNRTNEAA